MNILNSKKTVKIRHRDKDILVTLIEPIEFGNWIRVYLKPNGKYVGKLTQTAPEDWRFIFSFFHHENI